MKKYCVTIEETITQDFVVEANSPEEAREKIKQGYKDSKVIVDNYELQNARLCCGYCLDDPQNDAECTDWETL